ATATNMATVKTDIVKIGALDIAIGTTGPSAKTTHNVEAYIGPRFEVMPTPKVTGTIDVGGGTITVHGTSNNNAEIDQLSISVKVIGIDIVRPDVSAGGTTRAHLGGAYGITAGAVNVTAETPTNSATTKTFTLTVSVLNVGVASHPVATDHTTEAFV